MPRLPVYWLTAGLLAAAMTSQTLNQQWSGDAQAHAAAITELVLRPGSPDEPFVGGVDPSPYLSPWSLSWGLVATVTGWDSYTTLVAAALVNLVLLLVAFRVFVGHVGFDDRGAAIALVCVVALWGLSPWRWSGFINLNSLGFGLAYPSITAYALMLLTWTLVLRYLRRERSPALVAASVLMAIIALSHPFTALITGLGVVALLVAAAPRRRQVLAVGFSMLAAGALALLWPWYSLIDAALAGDAYQAIHRTFYEPAALVRLALLLVAVPVLVGRWRSNRRDLFVWFTILGLATYLVGWLADVSSLGRVIPLLVLGPQLAVAAWLSTRGRPDVVHDRSSWFVVAGWVAIAAGVLACLPGLTRAVPAALLPDSAEEALRFRDHPGSRELERQVPAGDTVLVTDQDVARGLVAVGRRVVSTPYIQPLIPDAAERSTTSATFTSLSPADRREAIDRYGIDWVARLAPDGEWTASRPTIR